MPRILTVNTDNVKFCYITLTVSSKLYKAKSNSQLVMKQNIQDTKQCHTAHNPNRHHRSYRLQS